MKIDRTAKFSLSSVMEVNKLLSPRIIRTPTIRSKTVGPGNIFVKCENLQITNSFKVRGALGALLNYEQSHPKIWRHIRDNGIIACSSGNFAQGLAYATKEIGLDYTVIVPAGIVESKKNQIIRYNSAAEIIEVPYAKWRRIMTTSEYSGHPGFFLSSESNDYVSLSTATVALEIVQDIPQVDAILTPYGGGNLSFSTASFLGAAGFDAKVYAVEVTTGAPLLASMRAGAPVDTPYSSSFIDGIGASFVIPSQFDRVKEKLAGVLTVTPDEIASSLSLLLLEDKILCEGAGAAAFAAALKYGPLLNWSNPCAVATGGVINPGTLLQILQGSQHCALQNSKVAA